MEYLVSNCPESRLMFFKKFLVATDKHCDFAARSKVNPTSHWAFQCANPCSLSHPGQSQHFIATIGGIFNPSAPRPRPFQDLHQHLFRNGGRRQAGENMV